MSNDATTPDPTPTDAPPSDAPTNDAPTPPAADPVSTASGDEPWRAPIESLTEVVAGLDQTLKAALGSANEDVNISEPPPSDETPQRKPWTKRNWFGGN